MSRSTQGKERVVIKTALVRHFGTTKTQKMSKITIKMIRNQCSAQRTAATTPRTNMRATPPTRTLTAAPVDGDDGGLDNADVPLSCLARATNAE